MDKYIVYLISPTQFQGTYQKAALKRCLILEPMQRTKDLAVYHIVIFQTKAFRQFSIFQFISIILKADLVHVLCSYDDTVFNDPEMNALMLP